MIKGVMFDFSGTLFRIESAAQWLRVVATKAGLDVPRVNSTRASAGWKSSGLSPEGFLRAQCRPIWRHCGGSAI